MSRPPRSQYAARRYDELLADDPISDVVVDDEDAASDIGLKLIRVFNRSGASGNPWRWERLNSFLLLILIIVIGAQTYYLSRESDTVNQAAAQANKVMQAIDTTRLIEHVSALAAVANATSPQLSGIVNATAHLLTHLAPEVRTAIFEGKESVHLILKLIQHAIVEFGDHIGIAQPLPADP